MARPPLDDIEELALCSCCQHPFDDAECVPKLLACKHHFCLACCDALTGEGSVCCAHCLKHTELPGGRAAALPTHVPVLALARRLCPEPQWCDDCDASARPSCQRVHAPQLRGPGEVRAHLQRDTQVLHADLARLATRQRDFLLRALDAATALKVRLEAILTEAAPPDAAAVCTPLVEAAAERERLRARHAEALLQCRLNDLVRDATVPLDFERLRRALAGLDDTPPPLERPDPVLFLANYCTAQLYTRYCVARRALALALEESPADSVAFNGLAAPDLHSTPDSFSAPDSLSPPLRASSAYPLFYFLLEMNGTAFGRVVVEVRDDVAPRMAHNFSVLATGELGVGYRGCSVFQCWESESVITGDFELNNGRGGRSVFEESYFMPEDTGLAAVRGAVGMRRVQKRHDNLGLVGSQFRIMLREMRGFTAIFGHVVEGLALVHQLSRAGDGGGRPHSAILISSCGRLN